MEISKFFQQKSNFHQTKNSFSTCKKKKQYKNLLIKEFKDEIFKKEKMRFHKKIVLN